MSESGFALDNCVFQQLGSSRCGRLLATLLADQGARAAPTEVKEVEIVIDDRTGDLTGHKSFSGTAGVILKLTDFPREHPRWSNHVWLADELIHAELGLNRIQTNEPDQEILGLASAYGALWGAIYIANAIRLRAAGASSTIELELPLFSAALTLLGRRIMSFENPKCVDQLESPMMPLGEIYACADGRFVQSHGTYPRFAEALCVAAGHETLRERITADFFTLPDEAAVEKWRSQLSAIFLERPALEWEERINAVGGSCTMCRTREEWLSEPHPRAVDIVASKRIAESGRVLLQGVRIAPVPGQAMRRAPTVSGALPLAGIKVIDFSIILAGPTCGRTLAEFGADVIKIDQAERPFSSYTWLDGNRGKRSILIDLETPEGRELTLSLIARADVVVENLRDGKLGKLGLGYEEAKRVNSSIVYCSINAFDYGGPWSERAGWEHNAQAATGMQTSRARNGVPRQVPVPANDFGTGLLGAYGVVLALMQRDRTGQAVRVRGSLARTASFLQFEELNAAAAGRELERRKTVSLRCSDGWLRVLRENDDMHQKDVEALSKRAATAPVEMAAATFAEKGYAVAVERKPRDLLEAEWLVKAGLMVKWRHPQWGPMRQGIAKATRSNMATRSGWPAPDPGADTAAILNEVGCTATDTATLMAKGAVRSPKPLFAAD